MPGGTRGSSRTAGEKTANGSAKSKASNSNGGGSKTDGAGTPKTKKAKVEARGRPLKKPRPCSFPGCKETFRYSRLLEAHMRDAHGKAVQAEFTCPNCSKTFTHAQGLKYHRNNKVCERKAKRKAETKPKRPQKTLAEMLQQPTTSRLRPRQKRPNYADLAKDNKGGGSAGAGQEDDDDEGEDEEYKPTAHEEETERCRERSHDPRTANGSSKKRNKQKPQRSRSSKARARDKQSNRPRGLSKKIGNFSRHYDPTPFRQELQRQRGRAQDLRAWHELSILETTPVASAAKAADAGSRGATRIKSETDALPSLPLYHEGTEILVPPHKARALPSINKVQVGSTGMHATHCASCPNDFADLHIAVAASLAPPQSIYTPHIPPQRSELQLWTLSVGSGETREAGGGGSGGGQEQSAAAPHTLQHSYTCWSRYGRITCMAWRAIDSPAGNSLGLMAVGFSSSTLVVASLPHPSTVTPGASISLPVLAYLETFDVPPQTVAWHDALIATGYANATCLLHQLPTAPAPSQTVDPLCSFSVTKDRKAVTTVAWKFDEEPLLATCGHTKELKLWRIRRGVATTTATATAGSSSSRSASCAEIIVEEVLSILTAPQPYRWWKFDTAWLYARSGPVVGGDDELLRLILPKGQAPPIARSFGATLALAASHWNNVVAYGGSEGWLMLCIFPDGNEPVPSSQRVHFTHATLLSARVVKKNPTRCKPTAASAATAAAAAEGVRGEKVQGAGRGGGDGTASTTRAGQQQAKKGARRARKENTGHEGSGGADTDTRDSDEEPAGVDTPREECKVLLSSDMQDHFMMPRHKGLGYKDNVSRLLFASTEQAIVSIDCPLNERFRDWILCCTESGLLMCCDASPNIDALRTRLTAFG